MTATTLLRSESESLDSVKKSNLLAVILKKHPPAFTFLLIVLVVLTVGLINPAFFQLAVLFDIIRACTVLGLFALGVMIVLAAGGIDVSFAAIAALTMYSITKVVMTYFP